MEQLTIVVPYDFIAARVRLNWRMVRFGMDEQVFSPSDAIRFALDLLLAGEHSDLVLELASMSREDSVSQVVARLANEGPPQQLEELRRVWAFLTLAWVFEQMPNSDYSLDLAEKIYADFGYPEQVAPLIRYMPSNEGHTVTPEARVFENWKRYLRDESAYFLSSKTND